MCGPRDRRDLKQLADAEDQPGSGGVAGEDGPDATPHAEADEENGEDDRKGVDGCTQHQREDASPNHFGGQGAEARQADHQQ